MPRRPCRRPATYAAVVVALMAIGTRAHADDGPPAARPSFQRFVAVRGAINLPDERFRLSDDLLNILFDDVFITDALRPSNGEVMKQHVLGGPTGANTWLTGWRANAAASGLYLDLGEEVLPNFGLRTEPLEPIASDWLGQALKDLRLAAYTTAGVRALRIEDDFAFEGFGSILGATRVYTDTDHDIVGPQVGLGVVGELSMFRFEAVALGLVGAGRWETEQRGVFGEEAIPGALNRAATARTPTSHYSVADDYVAWHGETRVTLSCQLTQHLRFDALWRWFISDPIRDSSAATAWNAPDFGIDPVDGRSASHDHWFLGLTYTH